MNELDRDGLQDMDYDVMKRVFQCEGKREVKRLKLKLRVFLAGYSVAM